MLSPPSAFPTSRPSASRRASPPPPPPPRGGLRAPGSPAAPRAPAAEPGAQLPAVLAGYETQLAGAGLADRAALFATATTAVAASPADPLVGLPLLLL